MAGSNQKRRAGMIANTAKELRPVVKLALKAGWELDRRGGHAMLVAPDGHREPIPTNARSNGLVAKFRKVLVDHGLEL